MRLQLDIPELQVLPAQLWGVPLVDAPEVFTVREPELVAVGLGGDRPAALRTTLAQAGIHPPPAAWFAASLFRDGNGWGHPITAILRNRWQAAPLTGER